MKSTLFEIPPDSDGLEEESTTYIRANSVEELAQKTRIGDDAVLNRVLLPGKQFGAYHILGFVAAGGMGEIYAAQRIKSDGTRSRPVALKVITAEYANDWRIIERFNREARISTAIRSRHVARVYEFGESPQGHAFLSMELLSGEELFDRLHRERGLSQMDLAEITLQILKGLHRIHETGFVHRDIKPENIFLAIDAKTGKESVKILDFGIAKSIQERSDPLLSVAGQIYGTPQYLAPEQAVNPDVDHRADLYSLGVVMYECVTGSLPFSGESAYKFIVAHQTEPVPPLPSVVDPEFAEIIYRALAKDPDERFQSALEMGQVLKRWVDETSWVEEDDPSLSLEFSAAPYPGDISMDNLTAAGSEPEQVLAPTLLSHPIRPISERQNSSAEPDTSAMVPTLIAPTMAVPVQAAPVTGPAAEEAGHREPAPEEFGSQVVAAVSPVESPSVESIAIPDTTELRSPRVDDEESDSSGGRVAQVVTGVALGLLVLAILGAIFL